MTWRPPPAAAGDIRSMYFFLSYAHSVPVSSPPQPDSDYWVRKFFDDLAVAVGGRSGQDDGRDAGFYDGLLGRAPTGGGS